MNILLVIAVVVSVALVLLSLARGLFHFSRDHAAMTDKARHDNHVMQNRMMMARIKWQAVTIVLLMILGFVVAASVES